MSYTEYIERRMLIKAIRRAPRTNRPELLLYSTVISAIANVPAADVVEVVRCKDCAIPHNKFLGCPYLNGLVPPENHFCSYGKRKEAQA